MPASAPSAHPRDSSQPYFTSLITRISASLDSLPYAFASHFAPAAMTEALRVYRERFEPGGPLERPHAMLGVNVIVAETDEEARRIFTTLQQAFTDLHRGTRGLQKPPIDDIDTYWTAAEKVAASGMLTHSFVGSRETVRDGLERFVAETKADELMVVTTAFDHDARKHSYELLAGLFR